MSTTADQQGIAAGWCSGTDADAGHCITCSDEGVPMTVVETIDHALVRAVGAGGRTSEVMTDLVGAVAPGDDLLVHAGVALTRLGTASERGSR